MKKNIMLLLTASLLLTAGCDPSNGTNGKTPDPLPDVTYSEVSTPPTISVVDESDYTVYYVDSGSGDDDNDGLSENAPFKTLGKVSDMPKAAKTKVLFKSGAEFTGNITLKNLGGTPEKPFIVDIYGGTERPLFRGNGGDQVVLIQDGNIRFRNIRITNKGGVRGIRVQATATGALKNIEIAGCRVEEVNWAGSTPFVGVDPATLDVRAIASDSRFNKDFGGIVFEAFTPKEIGASWFENLFVTDNEIYQVCRTGIMLTTRWGQRDAQGNGYNEYISDTENWYPSKNVVIQSNDIAYAGGDGLILIGCDGAWIDHNRCFYANFLGRTGHASAGLWPYCCTNVVMQYNEAAYTQMANGSADGEGLDVDVACKNTIVQFNYLHHNVGGGLLICNIAGANHEGTVVRNNIFARNSTTWKGNMVSISSGPGDIELYNNLVIVDNQHSQVLFSDDWAGAGKSKDISFRNNIFMSTSPVVAKFGTENIEDCLFENNIYHQIANYSMDKEAILIDPKITLPADLDGFAKALMMHPAEPGVFNSGMLFDGMLDEDITGNPAVKINYVGPFAK